MTTSGRGPIPRWRSLGPISLFTGGPWEIILPALLAGAVVAAAWISSPRIRIAMVSDWRFAAVAGASLAAMIAVRAFARVWSDAESAWPFVLASGVAGAVVLAIASETVLAPTLTRASDCAPFVAVHESTLGTIASYALPVAMWAAWFLYLLARFPHIEHVTELMHGRESRYEPYQRAIRINLPVRLLLSALVVAAVIFGTWLLDRRASDVATPEQIIAALGQPSLALADRARGGPRAAYLRAVRNTEQQKALEHLAALELDAARVSVRRCACEWLLPGDSVDPIVASAEPAFRVIDREIEDWAFAWKPSATTGAAVVRLLPLQAAAAARPPFYPLLWANHSPEALLGAHAIASEPQRVMYRGEIVMLVRRSTIATVDGDVLAEVAVKILGRSGRDPSLPDVVTARLHAQPSEGPCPIRGGSYCAAWSIGRLQLRLSPDESEPVTPDAPLWLSLFDPAHFPPRSCCKVSEALAANR